MYHEERVPKKTPMVITRAKLKMLEPPRRTRATSTRSVVPDVMVVRLSVVLSAELTVSMRLRFGRM